MIKTSRLVRAAAGLLFCATLLSFFSPLASAASISYGDITFSPGLTALNITESSGTDPVPLYGPPPPIFNGLDFTPQNFVASPPAAARISPTAS